MVYNLKQYKYNCETVESNILTLSFGFKKGSFKKIIKKHFSQNQLRHKDDKLFCTQHNKSCLGNNNCVSIQLLSGSLKHASSKTV